MNAKQILGAFQIWKFGISFKYSNLNQGLYIKSILKLTETSFENLNQNLNIFENQSFEF
jgi:hypothetical protein